MTRPGERVKIVEIRGGRCLAGKLACMSFYPGVEIEVISNRPGPLVISRGSGEGARLGIGHGMARRIIVSPIA
jgi:Fe2+ transport system protein FeoA